MTGELLLAIDVGTGSCRAVLFDSDGRQLAISQQEYSHPSALGVPGSQVFETGRNWELICGCIREVVNVSAPAGAVAAVSATSMREGMVLYDRGGNEIWACPNVDSRAGDEAEELVRSGAADEIYALAGDWVAITAPARFRWLAKHEPDLFASIARVGMLGDWVLRRLSGEFVTDPTLGSSSGMFELAQRDWSEHVIGLCGLARTAFPPVLEPGTVVGSITAQAAAETGLPQGTPVVVGGADTQLGLVGIGVVEPGRVTAVGGTFWQLTMGLDEPVIDPRGELRTLCHALPGQWMMEGIGFYCGLIMRWFRDAFCQAEREQAAREGIDAYALLERAATAVPPGSNGVFGIFSNLMNAKRWVHASPGFVGFDVSSPTRSGTKECVRAIEESAAYVTFGHLQALAAVGGGPFEEVVFTGGAAKGTLWPRILADVLGVPVRIPVVKESTALGAALFAGVGAGLYRTAPEAASRVVQFEPTIEPDLASHAIYADLYEDWLEIYARSLDLSETAAVRPLWRAAGT